jgi:thiol-disulfide isomerase/thioredoxin
MGCPGATLDFSPPSTPVPLVELRRLDGTPVQLRTLSDKPMVINLWATWCPPCRREMPALQDAQRRHPHITKDGRLFMRHVGELDRAGLDKRLNMLAPPG